MTTLLQRAFEEASKLSDAEQDELAERLLAELAEDEFDAKIAATSNQLLPLAQEALKEFRGGKTKALSFERP